MYIPELLKRDVMSTAQSFRSWDTCMANRTCKITAIVLICLGGLFLIWIFVTLVQCLCLGASCLEALCCCCCRKSRNQPTYVVQQPQPFNPNMYPPTGPPMRQSAGYQPPYQPPYQSQQQTREPQRAHFTSNNGYEPVDPFETRRPYASDELSFEEDKNQYRGYR
ncbi:uncharacterized protein RJT20DRAFT_41308 [Scheffersomyces xylosifermentans]|uniref:uncharacterized protein n=1 Tax=Scheffersomyces xylosifermentans TaxID=1304137 RepID=UPI00315D997B